MKKTTIAILTVLILTPLLLPLVQGEILVFKYSTDTPFSVSATEGPLQACTTQPFTDIITIQNIHSSPQNFVIQTNIEDRVSGTQRVTLNAEEERDIPLSISTRNTYSGDYTVQVTNQNGDTQQIQRNLDINRCQTIQSTLYRDSPQTQDPCQTNNYLIELQNPSPNTETYIVTGPDQEIIATPTLRPQQTELINHSFKYSCDIYGETNPSYQIRAQQSQLQTTLTDTLTINQEYPYSIELLNENPEPPYCTNEVATETYTVTNKAPFANNFTINVDGAEPNTTKIELESQQTTSFNVQHSSQTEGEQQYEITLTSEKGDVTETYNHTYNVENCYEATATIETDAFCTNEEEAGLTVTNNGRFTQNITTQTTTDIPNTDVETRTVTLQPGETQTLNTFLLSDAEGRNEGTLTLNTTHSQRNTRQYQNIQTQPIKIYDEQNCREPNIPERLQQRYTTQAVPIDVSNTGIKQGTYRVLLQSEDFTLSDTILLIEPGQQEKLYLDHNISNEDAQTYNPEITLRNVENNQSYTFTPTVTLIPTPWPERLAAYIQETPCAQIATALILLIILSLALSRIVPLPSNIIPIVLSALLIIPLVTYNVLGVPPALWPDQQIDTTQEGIQITTNQGQNKEIQLSNYFQDPDGDEITYTLGNLSIQHSLIGDELFIESHDTAQTETTTLTATDVANASTKIDLTIYTRQQQPTTPRGIYETNCEFINVLLVMILLTTLLFYKTKKNLQKPTERNTKKEIKEWLEYKNIPYTDNMTKQELLKKLK